MAATSTTDHRAHPVAGSPAPVRRRRPHLTDVLAVVAVLVPFGVVGIRYGLQGELSFGGDQALIQLDLLDLLDLHQGVGLYSRMGWAHPGPAWLVLLAPFYGLFGSTGAALTAASLLVHGLMAALVVVAAGFGGRWHRPAAAAVVLAYVLRMPAADFVGVWNPFALLLPTALLLLVAARACRGSVVAGVGTLVVGSYLVQTHVGTVPLAGAVGLVVVVVLGVQWVRSRSVRPGRSTVLGLVASSVLLVAMWVPPVVQQLTATGEGNLRMLADSILHGDPTAVSPSWSDTVSTVGQQLGASVFGWPALPAVVDPTILTPAVVAAVAVQVLACLMVAVLGLRTGVPAAGWLALVTLVATLAGIVSVHSITGLLLNYLVLWISILPAVALLAGIILVGGWAGRRVARTVPSPPADRRLPDARAAGVLTAVGATVLAMGLAVGTTLSLQSAAPLGPGGQPGVVAAANLAVGALPGPDGADARVLLDIRDVDTWTTATAVALRLEQAGYHVTVADEWVYGFGQDRRADGDETWVVSLASAPAGTPPLDGQVGTVTGQNGELAVAVTR
jgi:hypothetical protein